MGKLIIFNLILILAITALLIAVRRWGRGERTKRVLLLVAPAVTILFHYSSFIYRLLFTGGGVAYLAENPNLILPIYPCNVVMWCALIYGLLPHKTGRLGQILSDYVFWFGVASTLVGMFANVDFILNPTLADYEVTKSIVAHATLLFNVLLIPVLGLLRPEFFRNMRNMILAVAAMYVIGLYCNLIFEVIASPEAAYDVNSMFIIHSPFEGAPFLRYPLIAAIGLVIYLIIFTVCDLIMMPRGGRWYDCVLEKICTVCHISRKKPEDVDTAGEADDEDEGGLGDEEAEAFLAEALAGYRAQMEELYENRRRRAIAWASMTEEEQIAALVSDYEAVLADAEASGVEIVIVGEGDETEEPDEDGENEA